MLSQLGPLFKTIFRKAEQSDARLEIRREEKENYKQKEHEEEEEVNDIDLWEDTTYVSIEALRSFLVDFLKSYGDASPENNINSEIETINKMPQLSQPQNAINPQAARAQEAYAAMSVYAAPAAVKEESKPSLERKSLVDLLESDEIRTIHILIKEIDHLAKRNVHTLVIEKAETFLKALVMAVEKQKNNI